MPVAYFNIKTGHSFTNMETRFDLKTTDSEELKLMVQSMVTSTIKENAAIDKGRKGLFGAGLMKSLALKEPDAQNRVEKVFDFFRACVSEDPVLMNRASENNSAEYKSLLDANKITPWEFKALAPANEGTNSAGGYTVPVEFAADLSRNLGTYGYCRRYFRNIQMARKTLDLAGLLTKPSVALVAEGAAIGASKPVLDQLVLTAKKVAAIYPITNELLEDANIDTYSIILDIFTEQFQIFEDQSGFQNANTNWNGLLWYGAGAITSGIAANGARAYSRYNASNAGKTTYPQFGDTLINTGIDNWGDMLLLQTGQPSALFEGGKYFVDQNVLVALLSARTTQAVFGTGNLLNWGTGLDGQPKLTFGGYEIVCIPSGIMLTYDASAHVSAPFTIFCNPQRAYVMMGLRGGFFVDTLREATVDTVSLGEIDAIGIRMKERIAFGTGRPETVSVLRNDAS